MALAKLTKNQIIGRSSIVSDSVPGLKARSTNDLWLECTVCGHDQVIHPAKSLRTLTAKLNKFKREHNCCSAKIAGRAARRKRLN